MEYYVHDPKKEKKLREAKSNVIQCMQYLSLSELKILEGLAVQLAMTYSEKYREFISS